MLHTCPNCDVTCAQSATQWTVSVHTLHTLHTSRNLVWGGVGGWGGVQWLALYLHTYSMLRNCTCAHVRCYAIALAHMFDALAHMFDATQLHLRTCSMLRNCTCAHVRCYAIALAHMFDATQLHLHTSPFEDQAMDMACWTLACEPAFVDPQTLSKGVLKKCETN